MPEADAVVWEQKQIKMPPTCSLLSGEPFVERVWRGGLVTAFCLGTCLGYVLAPMAPDCILLAPLNYVRAVKLIAWDFRQVSQVLESWSGFPIFSGCSGLAYLGLFGFCGCCCSVLGLRVENDLLRVLQLTRAGRLRASALSG